jgi:hypothetical protein
VKSFVVKILMDNKCFFSVCQNDEKCFSSGILSDTEKKFHLFKCPNDINNRNADFFLSSNTN